MENRGVLPASSAAPFPLLGAGFSSGFEPLTAQRFSLFSHTTYTDALRTPRLFVGCQPGRQKRMREGDLCGSGARGTDGRRAKRGGKHKEIPTTLTVTVTVDCGRALRPLARQKRMSYRNVPLLGWAAQHDARIAKEAANQGLQSATMAPPSSCSLFLIIDTTTHHPHPPHRHSENFTKHENIQFITTLG